VALKKKLARTRSRASAFALITMKTRPEGVSYEKQQEVRKAFRKYGRIKPGEVMFDEVQALLRDMRTFITDEQLEGLVGMSMADLKRTGELSTPIGIDEANFTDLYLGVLDIVDQKAGETKPDVVGSLENLRATDGGLRRAFDELDSAKRGYLVFSELRLFVTRYGFRVPPGLKPVEFITKMFKKADVNGDGQIDFEEFVMLIDYILSEAKHSPFGPS
jgi:Ca2+-binding EF-hand superfamily protein